MKYSIDLVQIYFFTFLFLEKCSCGIFDTIGYGRATRRNVLPYQVKGPNNALQKHFSMNLKSKGNQGNL